MGGRPLIPGTLATRARPSSVLRALRQSLVVGAAAAALATQGTAQATTPLQIRGSIGGGEALRVESGEPQFVTVLAIARDSGFNRVHVLPPARGRTDMPRPVTRFTAARLDPFVKRSLGVASGTTVVVIASSVPPSLEAFDPKQQDGYVIVPDAALLSGDLLVRTLAGVMFAPRVAYTAALREDFVAYEPEKEPKNVRTPFTRTTVNGSTAVGCSGIRAGLASVQSIAMTPEFTEADRQTRPVSRTVTVPVGPCD